MSETGVRTKTPSFHTDLSRLPQFYMYDLSHEISLEDSSAISTLKEIIWFALHFLTRTSKEISTLVIGWPNWWLIKLNTDWSRVFLLGNLDSTILVKVTAKSKNAAFGLSQQSWEQEKFSTHWETSNMSRSPWRKWLGKGSSFQPRLA
jgi:hypothetical protein